MESRVSRTPWAPADRPLLTPASGVLPEKASAKPPARSSAGLYREAGVRPQSCWRLRSRRPSLPRDPGRIYSWALLVFHVFKHPGPHHNFPTHGPQAKRPRDRNPSSCLVQLADHLPALASRRQGDTFHGSGYFTHMKRRIFLQPLPPKQQDFMTVGGEV